MVRIRKNTASLPPEQSATRTTQAKCELNLYPWEDATPFTPQSKLDHQFGIEDDFPLHESYNVGAELLDATSERNFGSLKERTQEEEEVVESLSMLNVVAKRKTKAANKRKDETYVRCGKTNGRTWRCDEEAQHGKKLCEYHLVQHQSYQNKYHYPSTKKPKCPGVKKAKVAEKAQVGTSSTPVVANKKRNRRAQMDPADYYYYSGFGPSWGKRRRGGEFTKEELELIKNVIDGDEASPPSSPFQGKCVSSQDDLSVLHEIKDNGDEEEEGGDAEKAIARNLIKAKSLKSFI